MNIERRRDARSTLLANLRWPNFLLDKILRSLVRLWKTNKNRLGYTRECQFFVYTLFLRCVIVNWDSLSLFISFLILLHKVPYYIMWLINLYYAEWRCTSISLSSFDKLINENPGRKLVERRGWSANVSQAIRLSTLNKFCCRRRLITKI